MEFNFQKKKPSQCVLDQLMTPRNRNSIETGGMSATPDFHHPANFNPQVMMTNPQMESNHFPGLGDFTPNQTSSQIPQFMFDQGSPASSDEAFTVSRNPSSKKDVANKGGPKKSFQPMESFVYPLSESPQKKLPRNDFQATSRFNQQPVPFQNNTVSTDKGNNRKQNVEGKSVVAGEVSSQSNERTAAVKDTVSSCQTQEAKVLPAKTSYASELLSNISDLIQKFKEDYSKLQSENAELKTKLADTEASLKEYRDEAVKYKIKHKEVQEKLQEEMKNRETVLALVERAGNQSQLIDQHYKDMENVHKLHGEINREQKARYSELNARVKELRKKFERVESEKKMAIENFNSQNLELEKNLQESLRVREELSKTIEETNNKLCEEQKKCTTLEMTLVTVEKEKSELIKRHELSDNNFSEKYSELEVKFDDTKNELENLSKENADLKIYVEKYNDLKSFVENLLQEKETISKTLDSSQQNLSKLKAESTEQQKCLEQLYLEREKMIEVISKLKDECADLNSKLKEENVSYEILFNENKALNEKYQVISEDLEKNYNEKLRLEEEIKEASNNAKITEDINTEIKSLVVDLQKELSDVKSEVLCKTENVLSLEEKLSSFECKNEELHQEVKNLTETVTKKDLLIKDLTVSNSSLEINLDTKNEEIKQIQEELDQTKIEMTNVRQEMLSNVNQYRQHFMNEIKDIEQNRNELQSKYESTCKELGNLNIQLSKSEDERKALEETVRGLQSDLKAQNDEQDKITSLEKQVEKLQIVQEEHEKLKEKLKLGEKASNKENTKMPELSTSKVTGSSSASNRYETFDDDSSDSSIDVSMFLKRWKSRHSINKSENEATSSAQKDRKSVPRGTSKNQGRRTRVKFFSKTEIFG